MSRAADRMILAELAEIRTNLRDGLAGLTTRIDGLHTRLDTVVDSLAVLRRDFASHPHND